MADEEVKSCEQCGASIYPEHIGTHKAGYWGGKLFCVHCYQQHQSGQVTIGADDIAGMAAPVAAPVAAPPKAPVVPMPPVNDELDLSIPDDDELEAASQPTQQAEEAPSTPDEPGTIEISTLVNTAASSQGASLPGAAAGTAAHKFKRHLNRDGKGALRCRIFHAKLNEGALHFMEEQINTWIDQSPDVEVKHAATQMGIFEGKSAEPHLVVTVFY